MVDVSGAGVGVCRHVVEVGRVDMLAVSARRLEVLLSGSSAHRVVLLMGVCMEGATHFGYLPGWYAVETPQERFHGGAGGARVWHLRVQWVQLGSTPELVPTLFLCISPPTMPGKVL